jgi:hypothetical protein
MNTALALASSTATNSPDTCFPTEMGEDQSWQRATEALPKSSRATNAWHTWVGNIPRFDFGQYLFFTIHDDRARSLASKFFGEVTASPLISSLWRSFECLHSEEGESDKRDGLEKLVELLKSWNLSEPASDVEPQASTMEPFAKQPSATVNQTVPPQSILEPDYVIDDIVTLQSHARDVIAEINVDIDIGGLARRRPHIVLLNPPLED